jgi:hypothetical protein
MSPSVALHCQVPPQPHCEFKGASSAPQPPHAFRPRFDGTAVHVVVSVPLQTVLPPPHSPQGVPGEAVSAATPPQTFESGGKQAVIAGAAQPTTPTTSSE